MPETLAIPDSLKNTLSDGWPSKVDLKVILPGLVHYEDLKDSEGKTRGGTVLVTKEALDRMAASIEGRPIINWDHRKVDPKEYGRGTFQGIITGPAYFASDGWYHAPGQVWDKVTLENIQKGYSISCAYVPTDMETTEGTHNMVPYQAEVKDGYYTHVAVVPVPRYEGAKIELLNSSKGGIMGLLSFFRKDKPDEKVEFDPATAQVRVGDSDIPLGELINSYKAKIAKEPVRCGLEDIVEVDGKKVPVKELMNAHKEALENSMKDEHEEGKHKESPKDNCGMCNSAEEEEKKKKEAEEKENALKAEEQKRKEDEERRNAAQKKEADEKAAAEKEAAALAERRNKGGKVEMPTIKTLQDLQAEGERRYGPVAVK